MAATVNMAFPVTYLRVTPDGAERYRTKSLVQHYEDLQGQDRSKEAWAFRLIVLFSLAPVPFLLLMAVGFWVQRDDVGLYMFWQHELAEGFLGGSRGPACWPLEDLDHSLDESGSLPPIHILNGAANVPGSSSPPYQQSKTARFELSPVAVGGPATGWAPTAKYQGRMTLARAAAISSAVPTRRVVVAWGPFGACC
jgi:hypothetical protein